MKRLFCLSLLSVCATAFALPQASDVKISRNRAGDAFKIQYRLSAPAVVTVDVRVGDVSVGETALTNATGDVNALMGAGRHAVRWPVPAGWSARDADVKAVVTAWATNCPPDYMVINLTNANERIAYYTSTNALPAPLSDERWRTEYLVLRKIPAAGVVWRMGPNPYEPIDMSVENCKASRLVMLTEDFYLGVYEMTRRQNNAAQGWAGCTSYGSARDTSGFQTQWAQWADEMANVKDIPVGRQSYYSLRGGRELPAEQTWPASGRKVFGGSLLTMRNRLKVDFDLPTDVQWEFACRAGTSGQNYLNVDTRESSARLGEIAWYGANSSNATYQACFPQPVGLKAPNAFGLYDMLGNSGEWCVNWAPKTPSPDFSATLEIDPVGPAECVVNKQAADADQGPNYRAWRGGNFGSAAACVRSGASYGNGQSWGDGRRLNTDPGGSSETYRYGNGYRVWAPAMAVR